MNLAEQTKHLEEALKALEKKNGKKNLTVKDLIFFSSGKGKNLLAMLLSLPFCQPIQVPALSFPFGIAISLLGLKMTLGNLVWIPKKFLNIRFPKPVLKSVVKTLYWILHTAPRFIRPRFRWASKLTVMKMSHGLAIFIAGLLLALPLPVPFTNLTAAWSIFLLSFGILRDDGLVIFIGYIFLAATFCFFIFIALTTKNLFH